MSTVSEPSAQRVTLGELASQYHYDLEPSFASKVTITSLSDDIDSVIPGGLVVCAGETAVQDAARASRLGAYAVLVPASLKGQLDNLDIPVMYGDCDAKALGDLTAKIAGYPSQTMAMFAVTGSDRATIEENVATLSQFLHMLGNPVATISASGSSSMTRTLNLDYPLGAIDVQQVLSVCAEDGVAAVVIALDSATLEEGALRSTNIDVLGSPKKITAKSVSKVSSQFEFVSQELKTAHPDDDSRQLAQEARDVVDDEKRLDNISFAIAMVLAAGVRKANVRSALCMASSLK